ncbi:MAG: helix-turn-helix domain-containing protein [Deltaproteobacteria bacterium]|nr:helix-turn-helix domain-containing protein [Deltaproteobacteria bacterium]
MKLYQEKNHYELLEIHSDVAPTEIRQAYKILFDLYQDESIATYSFFSEKERKEILSSLEKAYLTLIDPESRKAYDRNRIELGGLEGEERKHSNHKKNPSSIYDFKKTHLQGLVTIRNPEELKHRASQNPVIQNILDQDTITGRDIKKIRTELKITLEEIAEATKVRIEMLRIIEEDNQELFLPMVYMTGFLKSYARYLQLDENAILSGFIKHINKGKCP